MLRRGQILHAEAPYVAGEIVDAQGFGNAVEVPEQLDTFGKFNQHTSFVWSLAGRHEFLEPFAVFEDSYRAVLCVGQGTGGVHRVRKELSKSSGLLILRVASPSLLRRS